MQDQSNQIPGDADPLAAVVLHTLVSKGRDGISAQGVARECERDPADPAEMHEIEMALSILLADDLVQQEHGLFVPTHAAIRAAELSF